MSALLLTGRGRSVGGFKLIWINWLLIFSWRGFRYEEDFEDANLDDWTHIINVWGTISGDWTVRDGAL